MATYCSHNCACIMIMSGSTDGTKPLPEQRFIYHQWGSVSQRQISEVVLKISICEMSFKNALVQLHPHPPGAN